MPTSPILHVAYEDQPLFYYEVALENVGRRLTDNARSHLPSYLASYPYVCFGRLLWWN